jgi:hypothetical protein
VLISYLILCLVSNRSHVVWIKVDHPAQHRGVEVTYPWPEPVVPLTYALPCAWWPAVCLGSTSALTLAWVEEVDVGLPCLSQALTGRRSGCGAE